ncbi:MAG: diguanylate cyclase [Myxococcales bacterium]|nr:diguanylate cyclase [Myxococcales bacterium]
MTTLVQAALGLRRGTRAFLGTACAALLSLLTLLGVFRVSSPGVEHMTLAATWALVLIGRVAARVREERRRGGAFFDLEIGLLLLSGAHALLQFGGGLMGPFYPALYVLVAFMSSMASRAVGPLLVASAVGYEAALYFGTEGHGQAGPFLLHAVFLMLFGLLNVIFTQAEISRVRLQNRQELRDEQQRVREDARLFRLVATPSESSVADAERLTRSSVEEVHQALFFNLDMIKRSMGLHTSLLLLADDSGTQLSIAECASDSERLGDGPFRADSGVVGAAFQRGLTMNLETLRPGYGGICYYREPAEVRSFLALPIREGDRVRGVLCADRITERPFSPADEELLAAAVAHLLRTMQNERVFLQLERSKREHSVLHRASAALGAALDEQAVLEAALTAAAEIAPFDFAAVTRYDEQKRTHHVRCAVGEHAERFGQLEFSDNTSLTAMTVKNRHYLPYRGEFDPSSQVVYTPQANLAGMNSLLILPLMVRDHATGTLALAARRRDAFGPRVRPALSVLANQLAVSLANAASVRQLEQLATTDGLTGCYNKRYFNEEMKSRIHAAERFGRELALIITDIDHFKSVNDTYGHATGDVVIGELGAILQRLARETDVVARFGGEEFCILCEETGAEGAVQLAERIRQELEATRFETELGQLKVTCSLGVATYPKHGAHRQQLFEAADAALYAAKHAGRNCVRSS